MGGKDLLKRKEMGGEHQNGTARIELKKKKKKKKKRESVKASA